MPPTKPPISSFPSAVPCQLGQPTPPEFLNRFLETQRPALAALVEYFASLTSKHTAEINPSEEVA